MANRQQIANYVPGITLAAPLTSGGTTATLSSVAGLPTVGPFRLRLDDVAPATTFEWTEVTSIAGAVVTFTGGAGVGRGLEGTSAIAHATGTIASNFISAAMLEAAYPWGILPGGYAQIVASQGSITTAVDITGLAVTVTVGAGRRIRISFLVAATSTVNSDSVNIYCMEGATQLQVVSADLDTNFGHHSFPGSVILTPTAAAHTYKLQASRNGGTGTVSIEASATQPGYILVEDIGSN